MGLSPEASPVHLHHRPRGLVRQLIQNQLSDGKACRERNAHSSWRLPVRPHKCNQNITAVEWQGDHDRPIFFVGENHSTSLAGIRWTNR